MEEKIDPNDLSDADYKILWKLVINQDSLFSSRINFLLIAVALSITCLFQSISYDNPKIYLVTAAAFLGVALCLVWFHVSYISINYTSKYLKDKLRDKYKWYGDILNQRPSIHKLMGIFLPFLFLIFFIFIYINFIVRQFF